jgi:two-component system sensor histidine kinase DegS
MLSQNIAKNILLLHMEAPDSTKTILVRILEENVRSFMQAHAALQFGDDKLEIPALHLSDLNKTYFEQIEPHFEYISQKAKAITNERIVLVDSTQISQLLYHESIFLDLMDRITFEFDKEAKHEIQNLKKLEVIIWISTIIILILEAFFIFKPIIGFANKQIEDNIQINNQLREAIRLKEEQDKRLEEEQRKSIQQIILAEEMERKRIARELHEGSGQHLSGIKFDLIAARDKIGLSDTGNAIPLISKSLEAVDRVIEDIRSISYDLIPPSLSKFGLIASLEEEARSLQNDSQTNIQLIVSKGPLQLDFSIEVIVFRIFQDILRYFVKFVESQEISVQHIQHQDRLIFIFDLNVQVSMEQAEMKRILTKVVLLKGQMTLEKGLDEGSCIKIEIPITNEPQ